MQHPLSKGFWQGLPPAGWQWTTGLTLGLTVGLVVGLVNSPHPASAAQELLTRAQVYKVVNRVQLTPNQRPSRPAKLSDVMVPLDALQTATQSRAELLFNEGSLARIGSNAIFRFVPGTRNFQLRNGTALIMSLPGQVATVIETPGGQVLAQALPPKDAAAAPTAPPEPVPLALAIRYDQTSNNGQIFALTQGYITITDLKGNSVTLLAGQTVQLLNGVMGPVQIFDLKAFYGSSQLALGLGPGQESWILQEIPPVQATLNTIRKATLAALAAQQRYLEGLCTLNGRGSHSTRSTNCITTPSDDALADWQNRREVTTPRPSEPTPVTPTPLPDPQPTPLPDPQPTPLPTPLPDPQRNPQPDPQSTPQGTVILIQGQGNNRP
jgi:hypothetical protein